MPLPQSQTPQADIRDAFHLQWVVGFALFFQPSLKDVLWADWLSIPDGTTYNHEHVGDASMLKVQFKKFCRVCGDRHCSIEPPAETDIEDLHSIPIPAHWNRMQNTH